MSAIRNILYGILLISVISILPLSARAGTRTGDPKLATKLFQDSTMFTMSIDGSEPLKVGSTFQVNIHVKPHEGWHVWSHDMSSDGGLTPLTVVIPQDLSQYFKLVGIRETGEVRTAYDSSFELSTRAHYSEYDVQLVVKVLQSAPSPIPFYVYLEYQTCNEIFCLQPHWYQVPMTVVGQKPLDVSLASVLKAESKTQYLAERSEERFERSYGRRLHQ